MNGRIDPAGVVEGFTVDIGASGSFCPKHVSLPVDAYFFNSWSDDDAPSPYLVSSYCLVHYKTQTLDLIIGWDQYRMAGNKAFHLL